MSPTGQRQYINVFLFQPALHEAFAVADSLEKHFRIVVTSYISRMVTEL
jgi:hypothetical protein